MLGFEPQPAQLSGPGQWRGQGQGEGQGQDQAEGQGQGHSMPHTRPPSQSQPFLPSQPDSSLGNACSGRRRNTAQPQHRDMVGAGGAGGGWQQEVWGVDPSWLADALRAVLARLHQLEFSQVVCVVRSLAILDTDTWAARGHTPVAAELVHTLNTQPQWRAALVEVLPDGFLAQATDSAATPSSSPSSSPSSLPSSSFLSWSFSPAFFTAPASTAPLAAAAAAEKPEDPDAPPHHKLPREEPPKPAWTLVQVRVALWSLARFSLPVSNTWLERLMASCAARAVHLAPLALQQAFNAMAEYKCAPSPSQQLRLWLAVRWRARYFSHHRLALLLWLAVKAGLRLPSQLLIQALTNAARTAAPATHQASLPSQGPQHPLARLPSRPSSGAGAQLRPRAVVRLLWCASRVGLRLPASVARPLSAVLALGMTDTDGGGWQLKADEVVAGCWSLARLALLTPAQSYPALHLRQPPLRADTVVPGWLRRRQEGRQRLQQRQRYGRSLAKNTRWPGISSVSWMNVMSVDRASLQLGLTQILMTLLRELSSADAARLAWAAASLHLTLQPASCAGPSLLAAAMPRPALGSDGISIGGTSCMQHRGHRVHQCMQQRSSHSLEHTLQARVASQDEAAASNIERKLHSNARPASKLQAADAAMLFYAVARTPGAAGRLQHYAAARDAGAVARHTQDGPSPVATPGPPSHRLQRSQLSRPRSPPASSPPRAVPTSLRPLRPTPAPPPVVLLYTRDTEAAWQRVWAGLPSLLHVMQSQPPAELARSSPALLVHAVWAVSRLKLATPLGTPVATATAPSQVTQDLTPIAPPALMHGGVLHVTSGWLRECEAALQNLLPQLGPGPLMQLLQAAASLQLQLAPEVLHRVLEATVPGLGRVVQRAGSSLSARDTAPERPRQVPRLVPGLTHSLASAGATSAQPDGTISGTYRASDHFSAPQLTDLVEVVWLSRHLVDTLPIPLLVAISTALDAQWPRLPAKDIARAVLGLAEAAIATTNAPLTTLPAMNELNRAGGSAKESSIPPLANDGRDISNLAESKLLGQSVWDGSANVCPRALLAALLAVSPEELGRSGSQDHLTSCEAPPNAQHMGRLVRSMTADQLSSLLLGLALWGQTLPTAWLSGLVARIRVVSAGTISVHGLQRTARALLLLRYWPGSQWLNTYAKRVKTIRRKGAMTPEQSVMLGSMLHALAQLGGLVPYAAAATPTPSPTLLLPPLHPDAKKQLGHSSSSSSSSGNSSNSSNVVVFNAAASLPLMLEPGQIGVGSSKAAVKKSTPGVQASQQPPPQPQPGIGLATTAGPHASVKLHHLRGLGTCEGTTKEQLLQQLFFAKLQTTFRQLTVRLVAGGEETHEDGRLKKLEPAPLLWSPKSTKRPSDGRTRPHFRCDELHAGGRHVEIVVARPHNSYQGDGQPDVLAAALQLQLLRTLVCLSPIQRR
ncbi:hypothetical protein QJQ45_023897 [Haematococcus lacustris]|nr:hypothetical protein QJQ45_023897 [Haematococcus lacustris]